MARSSFLTVLAILVALAAIGLRSFASARTHAPAEAATGWTTRLDADSKSEVDSVQLVANERGVVAQNGPNLIFYRASAQARGNYTLTATVEHLESIGHPHGAGVLFGGTDLTGSSQRYTYFLVRADGHYLIKVREGTETRQITPWTRHAAVDCEDQHGIARNTLRVEVGPTAVQFLVNGTVVAQIERDQLPVDGTFGYRMVHDLKVQFGTIDHQGAG